MTRSRCIPTTLIFLYSLTAGQCYSPPYCVNLKCRVKESRRDEFLSLIRDNQEKTLFDEPEALQYTVGEDLDVRNTFYIHEQFQSVEGFAYHRDTPHNANWQNFKAVDDNVGRVLD